MKRLSSILLMTLLCSACSYGGVDDPDEMKYLIYNYIPAKNDYNLERVQITTLTDVDAVKGETAFLRGGGTLTQGEDNPVTEEEYKNFLIVDESNEPAIEYTVEDDLVVPFDFDSAMMLTVYHHFERSRAYFNTLEGADLNIPASSVGEYVGLMPCYYYPSLGILGDVLGGFTDNAAYAYTLNAFLIPPRQVLTDAVPIYANRGVITHEMAHAVFNRLVYNNARGPVFLRDDWANLSPGAHTALNAIQGLDEGIADIFGALDTKDPNYIAYTISEELVDRDMAVERYYEACLHQTVTSHLYSGETDANGDPTGDGEYVSVYPEASACGGDYSADSTDPRDSEGVRIDRSAGQGYDSHHLGAVVGSIFWSLRDQTKGTLNDDELGQIVARALRDIQNPTVDFRVVQFFDALHDNLPIPLQPQACELFKKRMPAVRDDLKCST